VPLVVLDHVLDLDPTCSQRVDEGVGFGLYDLDVVGGLLLRVVGDTSDPVPAHDR
jgi:hypothetical protein